jgi:flagellar biosynthesis GTPase FlhF
MLEIFENPFNTFIMGFALGAVFLIMAYFNHWKTKTEFRRYKSHLSDKLELDAKQLQDTNKERARLAQENEHLRIQVNRLNEKPENKLQRELEVMARAEKHMLINAPGFAPAWEMAKSQAISQMETEEKGMSFPQKFFRKLIGPGGNGQNGSASLPENGMSSHGKPGVSETATTTTAA